MTVVAGEDGGSLWEALASVPDRRRAAGKRYPLASLLLIAVAAMLAAMLAGRRDQLGIVRWGRRLTPAADAGELAQHRHHPRSGARALGVVRRVPGAGCGCIGTSPGPLGPGRAGGGGRSCRDRWQAAAASGCAAAPRRTRPPGVHLLAAFSAALHGVIGQFRVEPEANEITAALHLLQTLPLAGVTITGDAIFAQKAICRTITAGGGDHVFTVKDNQPTLKADIALAFGPASPLGGCRLVATS